MNILITAICFVNDEKPGSEIYTTYAGRLINDVLTKTPYDVMITTNKACNFNCFNGNTRVIIRSEPLETHKVSVGRFNQLLKFFAIQNIDSKYDWVLYLDCDAGLTGEWNEQEIIDHINQWEKQGFDFIATRTNAVIKKEVADYEKIVEEYNEERKTNPIAYFKDHLFGPKFRFYNVTTKNGPFEWFDAVMPSEHVLLIKNSSKLPVMCNAFEDLCFKFEAQDPIVTVDMEAFEIGVSAILAGYKTGDFGNYGLYNAFKIGFNYNNWERQKY